MPIESESTQHDAAISPRPVRGFDIAESTQQGAAIATRSIGRED